MGNLENSPAPYGKEPTFKERINDGANQLADGILITIKNVHKLNENPLMAVPIGSTIGSYLAILALIDPIIKITGGRTIRHPSLLQQEHSIAEIPDPMINKLI